jgi:branched-chain amino acid transport system substrate-binding protein
MIATDQQEAQALGAYMRREQNGKALTVVFTDAFYRREMAEMVKAALPAEMRASLQLKPLIDSSSAYDHLVDQMKHNPPDVIYVALDNAMVLEFIGKLRKRGVKSLVVGGQRLDSQAFLLAKREVAEGIQIIVPIDTTASEFRKAADLLEQADVVPDLVALNTYAAIETWAQAVGSAGGADPEKVAQALRSGEFKTAVGRVAFDPRGLRRDVRYSVLTLQGGRLKPIESHP